MKEYTKEDFPHIDYIYDEICECEVNHEEDFIYDGKKYHAIVKYDGTYLEYGTKGKEVIFTQII